MQHAPNKDNKSGNYIGDKPSNPADIPSKNTQSDKSDFKVGDDAKPLLDDHSNDNDGGDLNSAASNTPSNAVSAKPGVVASDKLRSSAADKPGNSNSAKPSATGGGEHAMSDATQDVCNCHSTAASHHEQACKCHKDAIKCHEAGDHKAAAACNEKAQQHMAKAAEASKQCDSKTASLKSAKPSKSETGSHA